MRDLCEKGSIMENIKKIASFFALAAIFVGLLGGIGYALYCRAYFIAICLCVLGWAAVPKVVELYKNLMQ